ncbi:MAG TPA: fatty acyl-AMP ligase [Anaerolineae bacterium]|nr:fatty acyl-AMP ligase [Caldilineae bacterium]HID33905.1 fatty acyl-AMP ligase [Anaerolineae bacterium]
MMLSLTARAEYETLLDAAALREARPDAAAIIFVATDAEPVVVTGAAFQARTQAYAAGLQRAGVTAGDLVIIAHIQNLESIYAFWGALQMGAIPSMFPTLTEKLDPDVYMRNMNALVRRSHVRLIFTSDAFAPVMARTADCPVVGSSELAGLAEDAGVEGFRPHAPHPDDIAFLQHSSGTTGLQKGVALSHRAVLNQLASYARAIELRPDDVIVSWLPLYHDMGLIAGFIQPLVQGIPLVLMSPFDWVRHPALLLRAIHAYQGTLTWLPNFAYNHLARRVRQQDMADIRLDSMRMFINCSEPVRDDSHQLFLHRFADAGVREDMLAVSYAMAENTFAVTQTPSGRPPRRDVVSRRALAEDRIARPVKEDEAATVLVSCGPTIPNTQAKVVDEGGRDLPERRVGEIAIRSDCMLTGYYQRPDLNPFTPDGWYLTGDMGYLADGEVYIVGRKKDLIIHAGKNIYPQDIEAIVNEVAGVHPGRAVAFGAPDEREGTELIVVIAEVDTDAPDQRKAIAKAIRQAVARKSDITVGYVTLVGPKWLIKTSSGKIARAANREKWLRERASRIA